MSNALATITDHHSPAADNFDYDDPSASPVRGSNVKFDSGAYYSGKEKTLVEPGRRFVVLDRAEGWQFLKKDCPAEWVMRGAGQHKPDQPECDESTWPMGLDGEPSCPWKYTLFVYLIDADSGESVTFSTNSSGGRIAVSDLTAQIKSMRVMKPGAMPVVELQSVQMPTKFGKKPRPSFKITGWRGRHVEQVQQIEYDGPPDDVDGNDDSITF
jgi:hypothetical protein